MVRVICGTVVMATLFALAVGASGGAEALQLRRHTSAFDGAGATWCLAVHVRTDCTGRQANDGLQVRWSPQWQRGVETRWEDFAGYDGAWMTNDWSGNGRGRTGEDWHVRVRWVGPCSPGDSFPDGGHCLWGQFDGLVIAGGPTDELARVGHDLGA